MSSVPSNAPSETEPPGQTTSRLLNLIPELRNKVYILAFTADTEGEVELFTAAGPNPALLLSCRQVNNEARGLFTSAKDLYWSTTEFLIVDHTSLRPHSRHPSTPDEMFCRIRALNTTALSKITHLKINAPCRTRSLEFYNGFWRCIGYCCQAGTLHLLSIRRKICPQKTIRMTQSAVQAAFTMPERLQCIAVSPREYSSSHGFVEVSAAVNEQDLNEAKQIVGWENLT